MGNFAIIYAKTALFVFLARKVQAIPVEKVIAFFRFGGEAMCYDSSSPPPTAANTTIEIN